MEQIKKYLALSIVLAFICTGSLLLMFDYDTTTNKCLAVLASVASLAVGIYLGRVFDRKHLLPE